MARPGTTAGVVLLAGMLAAAGSQRPAEEMLPGETRAPARLDAVLRGWARVAVRDAHDKFTMAPLGDSFSGSEKQAVYHGEVFLRRPDRLRVEMKDAKGHRTFLAVFAGAEGRVYDFVKKAELRVELLEGLRLPGPADRSVGMQGGIIGAFVEHGLWFFVGPPAQGLEGRFVPRLEHEDDDWSYIRLDPKRRQGWLPDSEWQVVLDKKDFSLRRVWNRNGLDGEGVMVDFEPPDHASPPSGAREPLYQELPEGWVRGHVELGPDLEGPNKVREK
jgi:hypothetical protein